jgi:hypothetical protein
MYKFKAAINIIGINPFVFIPDKILTNIFKQAGREKGFIPVKGTVNDKPYTQTLVKYKGAWRLYINTTMLKNSPDKVGEEIRIGIEFNPSVITIKPHPKFVKALTKNKEAKKIFDTLPASRKKEIIRYIAALKTEESVDRNIKRAIDFLTGNGRFIGRDKP